MILGDFNAHSPYWNPGCEHRQRAGQLENIIDRYGLIVNNDTSIATRPKQTQGRSIIDLTLTTPDLEYLPAWTIDPEYATPSDHELITFDLENIDKTMGSLGVSMEITEWAIKEMTTERKRAAQSAWKEKSEIRPLIDENSSREDLDDEAQWIAETLTTVLNQHARKLRVCALSKR